MFMSAAKPGDQGQAAKKGTPSVKIKSGVKAGATNGTIRIGG
jgi:hypothetical protein